VFVCLRTHVRAANSRGSIWRRSVSVEADRKTGAMSTSPLESAAAASAVTTDTSRLARVQAEGTLRIGTTGDYVPFSVEQDRRLFGQIRALRSSRSGSG
jgi:hypothetical protein